MRLVLASASPRRAELLRDAGIAFEVVPADVDERAHDGETGHKYVRRLAGEKSAAAWATVASAFGRTDDIVVLAADTAVVIDGEILGKPLDDRDGAAMLRKLSGRRHEVMTGVSVRSGSVERGLVETTSVYMEELTDEDIARYVESGEGRDKAGGYGIQGRASRFIPRIDGTYDNVVGLPVGGVLRLLSELASAR